MGKEVNYEDKDSQEYVRSISPTKFEEYCKTILEGMAEEKHYQDFQIIHNTKMEAHDGTYQIDVFASCKVFGTDIKVLCECKQYSHPIGRAIVSTLSDKLYQLGCHKGIIMATSDFQSGAIRYAKEHGIALVKVYDYRLEYVSHSGGQAVQEKKDPFYQAEKMMPPYRAECYYPDKDEPVVVFPTKKMMRHIYSEMNRMIKEQWGYEVPDFLEKLFTEE